MIDLAPPEGCGALSIARLAAGAGVSSATFYEQFTGREDCFVAAQAAAGNQLLGGVRHAAKRARPDRALEAALDCILRGVAEDPAAGFMLFVDAMAGSGRPQASSECAMGELERMLQWLLRLRSASGPALDIPPSAIIGALRAVISRRLRACSSDSLPALASELNSWIGSYATPVGTPPWSTSRGSAIAAGLLVLPLPSGLPSPKMPSRLSTGRHNLPAASVERNHRERITHATAAVASEKGYAEMTVADIVAAAHIAREVFYRHHSDKRDAFLAAQRYNAYENQQGAALCFYEGATGAERMWNVLQGLTTFIAEQPAIAHLQFVEPFAVGAEARQRMDEITLPYAVYISAGRTRGARATRLPGICPEAIVGAIFEIIRSEIARGRARELPRQLPRLTYLAIAPYAGQLRAVREVERLVKRRTEPVRER